jgi:hypothetical protein
VYDLPSSLLKHRAPAGGGSQATALSFPRDFHKKINEEENLPNYKLF